MNFETKSSRGELSNSNPPNPPRFPNGCSAGICHFIACLGTDQIVIALRDRGFPVEYLLAPDEGHGFQRPVNSMAMFMASRTRTSWNTGRRNISDQYSGGTCTIFGRSPSSFIPAPEIGKGVSVETLTPVQLASGTTALQKVDGGDDGDGQEQGNA